MKKTVVIISINSDIGFEMAKRYLSDGYKVIGTYRSENSIQRLKELDDTSLFYCDVANRSSIESFFLDYKAMNIKWDVFMACPCTPFPLKSFFDSNFDDWQESIHINALEQLRLLHGFYALRNHTQICDVVFFAGGGVNNAVKNFSAYTVSKIFLIKMCELLNAENEDLNVFIVGPGWVRTKTHDLILKNLPIDDEKYIKTKAFLDSNKGTSFSDIYNCIKWLCRQGREVAGGRNFSVVDDKWKGNMNEELAAILKKCSDVYKLRRYGNDILRQREII